MATTANSTDPSDCKVVTSYDPNETSENKWSAWNDFYPAGPIGAGPTEHKAVQDLYDQIFEEGR
jgi:hypothetical protein